VSAADSPAAPGSASVAASDPAPRSASATAAAAPGAASGATPGTASVVASFTAFADRAIAELAGGLGDELRAHATGLGDGSHVNAEFAAEIEAAAVAPLRDLLARPGKRARPLLAMASAALHGGDPLRADVVVPPELLHAASLAWDDLEDDSDQRRGEPALHVHYGRDVATNAGGLLVALALDRIARAVPAAVGLATATLLRAHVGQAADLAAHAGRKRRRGMPAYLGCAALKSGALFEFAIAWGAATAGRTAEPALLGLARELAVALQLRDDCLAWTPAGVAGKTSHDDIVEGKLGFPLLHALAELPPAAADELAAAIGDPSRADRARHLVGQTGAVERGLALARARITAAGDACRAAFAGTPRAALLDHLLTAVQSQL
jgi:geranylgeranyl pyrophosphate synthase